MSPRGVVEGYQTFPFNGFGSGLNLRDKPDAVSAAECIDALNVYFSERGAIQQRYGYATFTDSALTNAATSLEPFYKTDGTKQLLAGCGTRLEALGASDGKVVASATGLTSAVWDFARFGQPNAEVAYAGNGTDTLRKWDGSSWSAPSGMPKAGTICVQETDNRLVAAGYSTTTGGPAAATSSPSHVYFSDAGDPETWTATSYVQLTPGDGERVQAVIAWREFVFVFKETKFFVFYSTGTDTSGNPIFNYRPVEAGVGLASPRAVCAAQDGVYFMDRTGLYRTTGQGPQLLSDAVSPLWSGGASAFYKGGSIATASITNCALTAHNGDIYLGFTTGSANDRVLLHDPTHGWFSVYDFPAAALASFRIGTAPELVFAYSSGSNDIGRHSSSYRDDEGTAISSRWRSGWFDLGSPDVKKIRASKVWGSGIVSMGIAHDFQDSTGTLDEIDMSSSTGAKFGGTGTFGGDGYFGDQAPSLVGKERRRAVRGTTFSLYFENSTLDQDFSVHRVEHLVPQVRDPAVVTA